MRNMRLSYSRRAEDMKPREEAGARHKDPPACVGVSVESKAKKGVESVNFSFAL